VEKSIATCKAASDLYEAYCDRANEKLRMTIVHVLESRPGGRMSSCCTIADTTMFWIGGAERERQARQPELNAKSERCVRRFGTKVIEMPRLGVGLVQATKQGYCRGVLACPNADI